MKNDKLEHHQYDELTDDTPTANNRPPQLARRADDVARSPCVVAEYRSGQTPIIKDLGNSSRGYIRLPNRSRIAVEWLEELLDRLFRRIRDGKTQGKLETRMLYLPDEWATFAHREKCLRGMGLAYLVKKRSAPLVCTNLNKSGTRIYRFQQ